MTTVIQEPLEKLFGLLLMQYRNSPNFIKYLSCYAAEIQGVYTCLQEELTDRYYDVAVGAQLDVVGEIVGARRTLEGIAVAGYFGYLDSAESLGMGKEGDLTVGGPFRSEKDDIVQDIKLTDPLFRNWIEARILKNRTNCNIEDCITFFKLLLNNEDLQVIVTEPANATVRISLGTTLTIYEAAQIRSLAQHIKPVGVTFIVEDENGVIQTLPILRGAGK